MTARCCVESDVGHLQGRKAGAWNSPVRIAAQAAAAAAVAAAAGMMTAAAAVAVEACAAR